MEGAPGRVGGVRRGHAVAILRARQEVADVRGHRGVSGTRADVLRGGRRHGLRPRHLADLELHRRRLGVAVDQRCQPDRRRAERGRVAGDRDRRRGHARNATRVGRLGEPDVAVRPNGDPLGRERDRGEAGRRATGELRDRPRWINKLSNRSIYFWESCFPLNKYCFLMYLMPIQ